MKRCFLRRLFVLCLSRAIASSFSVSPMATTRGLWVPHLLIGYSKGYLFCHRVGKELTNFVTLYIILAFRRLTSLCSTTTRFKTADNGISRRSASFYWGIWKYVRCSYKCVFSVKLIVRCISKGTGFDYVNISYTGPNTAHLSFTLPFLLLYCLSNSLLMWRIVAVLRNPRCSLNYHQFLINYQRTEEPLGIKFFVSYY